MSTPTASRQEPEPQSAGALPSEVTTRERRGFIFLLGATNLVFLGLDLRASWPAPALVMGGRIVLSAALLTVAIALRESSDAASARRVVRALSLLAALAFGAIVWGSGGASGPYAAVFGVLPIVFTLAVPDDLVATLIFSAVSGTIGVARVAAEGLAPSAVAFWCVTHAGSTGYAVASSVLHRRLRLRELRAREELVRRERQQARDEAERELLTRRLEIIGQTVNDILLLVGSDGAILQANDRALQAYGYSEQEILRLSISDLRAEATRGDVRELMKRAVAQTGLRFRTVHRRRDGTTFPVEVSSRPLERAGTVMLQSVIRDVSEEAALRASQAELLQAQKLEAVGRLAAGIAHEINTPIQYIGDSAHFLGEAFTALAEVHRRHREALAQSCPEEVRSELDRAERDLDVAYLLEETPKTVARALEGVRRVSTIVRAMKEFAHPDQDEPVSVDLNRALQATLDVARNEYKYVADVETDFGEIPAVSCVAGDLNQVFLNIIVNAAHGIESVVSGTQQRGTIRITTRRDGGEVVVAIADTGCGISEAIRDKVFDPFFTTKPVGRGTGQGLAIARSIVKKHGGHLSFTSAVGVGTTFSIRLPVQAS